MRWLPASFAVVAVLVAAPARPGFSAHVDNVWFPLKPGTVDRYKGVKDGKPSREVLTVTHRTAVVDGAPYIAVDDRLWVDGYLEERTTDWYNQDAAGNVMFASPRVGRGARQEFYKGEAEDHFRVVSLRAAVHVAWGSSSDSLLTKEWTPLEPGVLDHKFYVRGVGTVLEQTVKGGNERNELISVSP